MPGDLNELMAAQHSTERHFGGVASPKPVQEATEEAIFSVRHVAAERIDDASPCLRVIAATLTRAMPMRSLREPLLAVGGHAFVAVAV